MKNLILIVLLLISEYAFAKRLPSSQLPSETLERLKLIYPNQSEEFLLKRIAKADGAFSKWRSFPPYYYDLINRLQMTELNKRSGLCAGDAHFENFGYLYYKKSEFYLNDLDDSSPCSLNADLMRLYIGLNFIKKVNASAFIDAYKKGLGGLSLPTGDYLEGLFAQSKKEKNELHGKNIKMIETESCKDDYKMLSDEEKKMIVDHLKSRNEKFVWGCSRNKDTGGSAGLKRFVAFFKTEGSSEYQGIEIKPLVTPSPLVYKKIDIAERVEMFKKAVSTYMSEEYAEVYFPIILGDVLYQRKPLYKGNIAIELKGPLSKEMDEVMLFEANRLGLYHKDQNSSFEIDEKAWVDMSDKIEAAFRKEFAE